VRQVERVLSNSSSTSSQGGGAGGVRGGPSVAAAVRSLEVGCM